jgi:hypothetical protein
MLSAILILLAMPFTDLSRSRGLQFRPLSKIAFYIFVANFFILMVLGAKHVESPFIELGQICTVLYFAHFLVIVPFVSILENSSIDLSDLTKQYTFVKSHMQSACIHGLTVACQQCWNMTHQAIILCTHKWYIVNHPGLVGVACDFGFPPHSIVANTVVHSCHICHAICCSGCIA